MSDAAPVFGIDLGTTYSAIAHVDEHGAPVVIKNEENSSTTPSVVLLEPGGNVVVGQAAKTDAVTAPDRVFEEIKRSMGDPNYIRVMDGKEYRPEMVSSLILRKLVSYASAACGVPVQDVVITVPAYFNDNQREATRNAGQLAGLNVLHIINEPTAAALCYGMDQEQPQNVLVYDLGGGTFDVTIIQVSEQRVEVVVTGGDRSLGGKLWDHRVMNYVAGLYEEEHGENPLDDPELRQELTLKAEEAKRALTNRETVKISFAYNSRMSVELTRAKFDEITSDLLDRTLVLTQQLLDTALDQKGVSRIDTVLLVGGSTRMLQVEAAIRARFGFAPRLYDPDESVAKGAALMGLKIRAGKLIEEQVRDRAGAGASADTVPEAVRHAAETEVAARLGLPPSKLSEIAHKRITNVVSHSLGIVCLNDRRDEVVDAIIPAQSPAPAEITKVYGTVDDFQQEVRVRVMQGESASPYECEELGDCLLSLPAGLPRGSGIEVTFRLTEEGVLDGQVRELSQGRAVPFNVKRPGIMSAEEVASARRDLLQMPIS